MTEQEANTLRTKCAAWYMRVQLQWFRTICEITHRSPPRRVNPKKMHDPFLQYLLSRWEDDEVFLAFHDLATSGYRTLTEEPWDEVTPAPTDTEMSELDLSDRAALSETMAEPIPHLEDDEWSQAIDNGGLDELEARWNDEHRDIEN